jgi:hypothetical protein
MCLSFSKRRHALLHFPGLISPRRLLLKSVPMPQEYRLVFDLAFSHSFCLRDVAWIRPADMLTMRADVGTTSPTVRVHREPPPNQSKYRFASLQHHPPDYRSTPTTRKWKGCSWGHFKKADATHAQDSSDGNALPSLESMISMPATATCFLSLGWAFSISAFGSKFEFSLRV